MTDIYENNIPGWMTNLDLHVIHTLAKYVPPNGSILEIGCFLGRSTTAIYQGKHSSVTLEVIDPFIPITEWAGFKTTPDFQTLQCKGDESLFNVAVRFAEKRGWFEAFKLCVGSNLINSTLICKGLSKDHVKSKDYDMVFIDGSHQYEDVVADIMKYSTDTNLILGDDFLSQHPGVCTAVSETRDYKTLVVFGDTKIWALIPKQGYWRELFNNNNLLFMFK